MPPDPPAAEPAHVEPAPAEPTPMDNLLAVAELELELASGASPAPAFSYREEEARDMSFSLGEPKPTDELFFESKACPQPRSPEDDLAAHKELFDSISEAHYLPELGGPHDEALLESLVEKGCEDNQILGQALDKLAHLVAGAPYAGEDMLLDGAPVHDIIERLEALESPGRSSMSAAQGLLHLHRHPPAFLPPDSFPPEPAPCELEPAPCELEPAPCELEPAPCELDPAPCELQPAPCELQPAPCALESAPCQLEPAAEPAPHVPADDTNIEYELTADKRLQDDGQSANVLYTEPVPDLHETYDRDEFEESSRAPPSSPAIPEVIPPLPVEPGDTEPIVKKEEDITSEESDVVPDITEDKGETIEDLKPDVEVLAKVAENPEVPKDLSIMYIEDDGEPRDLSLRRRLGASLPSPRRIEIPRAPSRESDAMQSPQPSGIPAIASPEVFQAPSSKTKTQSILDAMFTSASPKYLTSEVSITKQQCEPLNLGKHRKSASPTVSSCSEEKSTKSYGEPLEKRQKRSSMDDLYQLTRMLTEKKKRDEKASSKKDQEQPQSSLKQFQNLKANKNFNIPDPLLIPKERFAAIQNNPGKEIPALLVERPELRYYDDLDEERDRDIIIISVKEFENILLAKDNAQRRVASKIDQLHESAERGAEPTPPSTPVHSEPQGKPAAQPKSIPSMGALAEDIDAATSATLGPMLWAQYAQQQMEAVAACSQNAEFLKALNASGYGGANYADLSQMLMSHPSRLVNPAGYPVVPPVDYERMQLALWQEMMLQKMQTQRRKSSAEAQMKEAAKEFQSPYVHSTNKGYQGRAHSAARTSPIAGGYGGHRGAAQNPFLAGMYPGMGARGASMPMPPLGVPYYPPAGPRSPRSCHKSPTPPSPSGYYPGMTAAGRGEAAPAQRAPPAADATRPRISVKKVDELRRRRDDAEVGSTTPLGEPPLLPPDSSVPLWHPLFGNQKNYTSPWSWTTVTATGD